MKYLIAPILSSILCVFAMADSPKRIALVFDDGPHPEQGQKLLSIFAEEGIHVTFSHIAKNALDHPELCHAYQEEGHEIANHSFAHLHPADLTAEELQHEVAGAQAALTKLLLHAPVWYWPPFLEINDDLRATVEASGIEIYEPTHLVDTHDWNTDYSAEDILEAASTDIPDRSVILFHEWRPETAEQMPTIIHRLKADGYQFMTFSELRAWEKSHPVAP